MINDLPKHVIFPHDLEMEQFNRAVFGMSNHDYDLDEITAAILNALAEWDEIEDNKELFLQHYGKLGDCSLNSLDKQDSDLLYTAVDQYFDAIRKQIDIFDSRTSDGSLLYRRFTIHNVAKTITYHL